MPIQSFLSQFMVSSFSQVPTNFKGPCRYGLRVCTAPLSGPLCVGPCSLLQAVLVLITRSPGSRSSLEPLPHPLVLRGCLGTHANSSLLVGLGNVKFFFQLSLCSMLGSWLFRRNNQDSLLWFISEIETPKCLLAA